MTTKIKVSRFRTRPADLPPPEAEEITPMAPAAALVAETPPPRKPGPGGIGDLPFSEEEDGFGDEPYDTARSDGTVAAAAPPVLGPVEMEAIRREGLTGRQLRMARRLAQKHGLPATSDFDAVRLLRKSGIDPFQKSTVLELVAGQDLDGAAGGSRALTTVPGSGDGVQLPQTVKPAGLPATEFRQEDAHIAEIRRIQKDMVRRRRRKVAIMWARLSAFVMLPTLLAGWYFYFIATPMFTAHSEFVIQQATPTGGAFAGLLTGTSFATSQDSVVVQGYLQSPEAMNRLDEDLNFRAVFSDPTIDSIQRLAPDASNTQAYNLFKKYVKISYDPTEGVIKMDVSSADPKVSVAFAKALIGYAEEQVDHLTQRLRDDQMQSARDSFADAQAKLTAAQTNLITLQEKYKTLSSEAEAGLITTQVAALDTQLTQERLSLAQMESNANPNKARMDPVKRRIATLEDQIAQLRSRLTVSANGDASLATVQSDLLLAQAEVQTRQMMLAQATTATETARIEANRQTRYLSIAVPPDPPPDQASYPKSFENTLVVMLIFGGLYLMFSMTVAILREQVTG